MRLGCEYCDKGKNISNSAKGIEITISDNLLEIEDTSSVPFSFYTETEINYCPICGRKLNGRIAK